MQTRDLDIENVQSLWIKISQYSIKSPRRSTVAMKERQGALAVLSVCSLLSDQEKGVLIREGCGCCFARSRQ